MSKRILIEPVYVREFLRMDKVEIYGIVEQHRMYAVFRGNGNIALYLHDIEEYLDDEASFSGWTESYLTNEKSRLKEFVRMQNEFGPEGTQAMRSSDADRELFSPHEIERGWLWDQENEEQGQDLRGC